MRILCIGDIVSRSGREMLRTHLNPIRTHKNIDLVIANAENASHGRGITRNVYEELTKYGIDGFTMGNHTWGCKDVITLFRYQNNIIRPLNYSGDCPGRGSMLLTAKSRRKVGIINLLGRIYMDPCESPFLYVEKEIERLRRETNMILVDFHAEATSEKQAMGWFLDGRVSAVFGTHTHVQTADETILPKGTGYITDLGMTGPVYSVLGMDRQIIIDRFLNGMPGKFEIADGKGRLSGCIFELDEKNGKTVAVERIHIE